LPQITNGEAIISTDGTIIERKALLALAESAPGVSRVAD
jgi:hypothetical protein